MKLKYTGKEERMVHLKNRHFKIVKGESFDVNKEEVERFKDKDMFVKVKKNG